MSKIKNIGILAHVDAGKTTITENFLFIANSIKSVGSVDKGSSVSDSMALERERGISIRNSSVSFIWKNITINLIDTPGHADFSAEVERALAALDGVILVISAVEGIQSHTITLWETIKQMGTPCLFFVNKIDRVGADFQRVLQEINKELNAPVIPLYVPDESIENPIPMFLFCSDKLNTSNSNLKELAIETLADRDEEVFEKYLAGEILTWESIKHKIADLTHKQKLIPIYSGVAKLGFGMEPLLDGVLQLLPNAKDNIKDELSALVFKLDHDKTLGKVAHVRLFSGEIKTRDTVINYSQQKEEKIAQIKKVFTHKMIDASVISAGDIGIVTGLQNTQAGDILGSPAMVPVVVSMQKPVLTVQVKAINENQYADLAEALFILNTEDPLLDFSWYKDDREMHLKLMGAVQIEILKSVLEQRFGIETEFDDPTVIYKETPASISEGYIEYTMPKPCWAVMRFQVEPGSKNSGIEYSSKVGVNDIHRKYQNEIKETIPKSLVQGIKGWEVTDIKVTMIAGEDHEIHSRPGDFILATPIGVLRALENSGTRLLEPVYNFQIKAPEEFLGAIVSDLTKMRASFESPEFENESFSLNGIVPVSSSLKYHIRLSSLTGGKGRLRMQFVGYEDCPEEHGKTREFKGVNPLNKSQWILHKRGAFKANERKF
ncbi:TetM/TetW/TetO/TetS family tetracycline resistance ribosomal protection protein [Desulfosarcina sp.]|nr:TetM/TetW/TetO/TetS family tetracycline resistance ribosomal protection protein [Desulfosarcina sp.]